MESKRAVDVFPLLRYMVSVIPQASLQACGLVYFREMPTKGRLYFYDSDVEH
jgi:hypothetical protein